MKVDENISGATCISDAIFIAATEKPPWLFSERACSGGHASYPVHDISFVSAFLYFSITSLVFVSFA